MTSIGIVIDSSSHNTLSNINATSSMVNPGVSLKSNSNYNILSNINASTPAGIAIYIDSSSYNTIANSTATTHSNSYYNHPVVTIASANSNTIINTTLISSDKAERLLDITSDSNSNTFCWNNFTETGELYVNDLNGNNIYNSSVCNGEGNIYANVMNGSVNITGSNPSSYGSGLYIGTTGTGYPYNSMNSQGKVSAVVVDYAPLTIKSKLTVTKVVINDNGGIKTVSDFPLFVNSQPVISGQQNEFDLGTYTVSETNLPGYNSTITGDCATNGAVTLEAGQVKNCIITNDDIPVVGCTCGVLSIPNSVCTLTNNLSNTSTCFTVTAQNVTIDCAGHSITGSNAGNGIYSTQAHTTIKNCRISNFSTGISFGENPLLSYNIILNNSISATTDAISINNSNYPGSSDYNTISNNVLSTTLRGISIGSSQYSVGTSNNNTISNNVISAATNAIFIRAGGSSGSSSRNIISNNTISASSIGIFISTSGSGGGDSNSDINTIIDNTIVASLIGISIDSGLYATGTSNNNIISNNTISSSSTGISISSSNDYTGWGSGASNNNVISNNIIFASSKAIFISAVSFQSSSTANNNTISSNILSAATTGISISTGSGASSVINNTISKNILSASSTGISLGASNLNNGNVICLNSFTNISGLYIITPNMTNNFYTCIYDGKNQGNLYQNVLNGSVQITGTVLSSISGYYIGTAGMNYPYNSINSQGKIFGNAVDSAPLTPRQSSPTPLSCICGTNLTTPDYVCNVTSDQTSNGTCFNVQARNVTILCNGRSLTGNGTGDGIFSDQTMTNAMDCNMNNFENGIHFQGATNGIINNTQVLSNVQSAHGILLSTSTNNQILNSAGTVNSNVGILLDSSSYNTIFGSNGTSNTSWGIVLEMSSNNNQIINSYGMSNEQFGIFVYLSSNNTITNSAGISNGDSEGIYLWSNSDYTTIANSTGASNSGPGISIGSSNNYIINSRGTSSTGVGIDFFSGSNNILLNSVGTSNSSYGIYLDSSSNNTIASSRGTSSLRHGIFIDGGANNLIINSSGTSDSASGITLTRNSNNTISNSIGTSNAINGEGIMLFSSSNNTVSNSTGSSLGNGIWIETGSDFNTISNCTFISGSGVSAIFGGIPQPPKYNTFVHNTLISSNGASALLFITSDTSNNTFYWNNFTATSSYYIRDDSNSINFFNAATPAGTNEGNIYANVMNGSVPITGSILSNYGGGLYIGDRGAGYPYNSMNSQGKVSASVVDYAPLTPRTAQIKPKLTVTKVVINDNGGTRTVSDFPLFVSGQSVISDQQNEFNAGTYIVSETNLPGYSSAISGDCAANGIIMLETGQVKNCTITNNDVPAVGCTCGVLSTPNSVCTLTRNLTSRNTCFNVTAANVTLDCNGFSITGVGWNPGTSGVYTNQSGTAVKNCQITDFDVGIYFNTANNGLISNTRASSGESMGIENIGIYLLSSSGNTIINSNGTSPMMHGIYVLSSSNNQIINTRGTSRMGAGISVYSSSNNNTITDSNGTSERGVGIYVSTGSNFNTVANSTGTSISHVGILIDSNSSYNTIANCRGTSTDNSGLHIVLSDNNRIINSTGISSTGAGIYIDAARNIDITNSAGTATSSGAYNSGIYIAVSSNVTVDKSAGTSNVGYGINLEGSSNNKITGCIGASATSQGLYIWSHSDNNTITNSIITSGNSTALIVSWSRNNLILNNQFHGNAWIYDRNGGNTYGSSSMGNAYYFANGNGIWTAFDIHDTDGDGWADSGSALPFNSTDVGANLPNNWEDWHPYIASPIGNAASINTTLPGIDATINGSSNFAGTGFADNSTVSITSNSQPILTFNYNFTASRLDFSNISIATGRNGAASYAIISGIDASYIEGGKTLYIYSASTSYNSVCIKDVELASVEQISSGCNGANETSVPCSGVNTNGYTCTFSGTTLTITGLKHSGVEQQGVVPADTLPATSGSSGETSSASGGSSGSASSSNGGSGNGGGGGGAGSSSSASAKSTTDVTVNVGGTQCIVTIGREMESSNTSSVLTTTLTNVGGSECAMANFVFTDTIPSSFASMPEISFSLPYNSATGAKVTYIFPAFANGESKTFTYTVAKWVPTRRANDFTDYSMLAEKPALQPVQPSNAPAPVQTPNVTQPVKKTVAAPEAPAIIPSATAPKANENFLANALFDSKGNVSLGALSALAIASFVALALSVFVVWRKMRRN